jgi:hypothetical protein
MLCFVHVPKAAGTTVDFVLHQSLGYRYTELTPWVDEQRITSPADVELLRRWAPWIRHLGGHHVRAYSGLERVAPNIQYLTFLRDPVQRYLSDYYHRRYKNRRVANFYEYLSNKAWRNKQTKYIAGTDDVEAAKQLLRERFEFVGLVEAMHESLVMLKQRFSDLHLDVRYGRPYNVGLKGPGQQEIEDGWSNFEPHILAHNQSDIELYAYARDVIFARQQEAYGPNLAADVTAFEQDNQPSRRCLWSYYSSRAHYKLLLAYYRRYGKYKWPIDNRELSAQYDFFGECVF